MTLTLTPTDSTTVTVTEVAPHPAIAAVLAEARRQHEALHAEWDGFNTQRADLARQMADLDVKADEIRASMDRLEAMINQDQPRAHQQPTSTGMSKLRGQSFDDAVLHSVKCGNNQISDICQNVKGATKGRVNGALARLVTAGLVNKKENGPRKASTYTAKK